MLPLAALAGCGTSDDTGTFTGTWNYVAPDRQAEINLGVVACPPPGPTFVVPQIGSIAFERIDDRTLLGATDQGCSWRFGVSGATAALDPPSQTCENHVIGSSYPLAWSIAIDGDAETEVLDGTSPLPTGDCHYALANGSRSRVAADDGNAAQAFVGTSRYVPPDPQTGVDIEQLACGADPRRDELDPADRGVVARARDRARVRSPRRQAR